MAQGYEGMKRAEATIPAPWKPHLAAAGDRVVRFYESTNRPAEATAWRAKHPAAK